MRLLYPSILLFAACIAPQPNAPPLTQNDGGLNSDVGGESHDTGTSTTMDAGHSGGDAGEAPPPEIPPARVDAGFTPEVPDPPPSDACSDACGQGRCAEACYETCLLASYALGGEQRNRFLECVTEQEGCDVERCIPEEPRVTPECERVCGLREGQPDPEREPSPCADLNAEPAQCMLECNASLSIMTPAAQQSWLHCSLDGCRTNPNRSCDIGSFLSPNPSQACLDAVEHLQQCDERDRRPAWARAHADCELYRSPGEQRELGGNAWAECLSNTQVCGDWIYIECLTQTEQATGRGAAVREMCAPMTQCDEGLGYQCRIYGQGVTGLVGGFGLETLQRCIDAEQDDCNGLGNCMAQLVERPVMAQDDPCIAECNRCGLPGSVCGAMCVRVRNSLSVRDADRLHRCMQREQCGLDLLTRCTREVLPRTMGVCERFLQSTFDQCPNAFEGPASVYAPMCALSGVRTGYLTEAAMRDCVDRIPCVDDEFNPLAICMQGLPQ
ncbi:MAG TPA: hypothetical protein DEB46_01525 [Myxococcales bacterium]|nr:hypothetical protein [Myxococcales bacterium]